MSFSRTFALGSALRMKNCSPTAFSTSSNSIDLLNRLGPCRSIHRHCKMSFNYLARKNFRRWKKRIQPKAKKLEGNPFKRGVVTSVYIQAPKKPNSANRKCCNATLSNGKKVRCSIPGEGGHTLFEHSTILIRGGRTQDLIGYKYKAVRGVYDLKGVVGRKTSRSKYGTKQVQMKR